MKNAKSTTPGTAKQKRPIFSGPWIRIYSPDTLLNWFCVQCRMAHCNIAYTLACDAHSIYCLYIHFQGALRWLWTFDVHPNHPCRRFYRMYYHYQSSKRLTSFNSKNQE
jgi:hypothetical protein